jgi:hypothetical protein
MFADLVGRIPQIKEVAERIKGRKLRVATMCSGTESPLLALELICGAILDQYDVALNVEHVFSCEIEPFKQAYIERNFHPPILFRDVCELGETHAYVLTLLLFVILNHLQYTLGLLLMGRWHLSREMSTFWSLELLVSTTRI